MVSQRKSRVLCMCSARSWHAGFWNGGKMEKKERVRRGTDTKSSGYAGKKYSVKADKKYGVKADRKYGEKPEKKYDEKYGEKPEKKHDVRADKKYGDRLEKKDDIKSEKVDKQKQFGDKNGNGIKNGGKSHKPSVCPVSRNCGGCEYIECSYQHQLKEKETQVHALLKGICPTEPIIGMENPYHYRNKVNAAFRYQKGEIISGTYEEGSHRLVRVDSCLIEDEKADAVIRSIRDLLKSFKIKIYDEDTGYGLLRHVMVRRGFASGELMVVLVTVSPIFPSKNNFVRALRSLHPEITTVVLNVNDRHTSMVLGERNITLYGKGYIEDQLCGLTFRLSPQSFYQVNPVQTERLYSRAIELAGLTGNERVIDAYCGIGTIGLIASSHAREVVGIELNPAAVRDAVINAKRNDISNVEFLQGDAGEWMTAAAQDGEHADVVIMDPPRQGSTEAFMTAAAKLAPEKIVYISCNPETLARDLKVFQRLGYRAKTAQAVDMFPWSGHVETVCLLGKRKPDTTVKLSVDMDDYYRIINGKDGE